MKLYNALFFQTSLGRKTIGIFIYMLYKIKLDTIDEKKNYYLHSAIFFFGTILVTARHRRNARVYIPIIYLSSGIVFFPRDIFA